MPLRLKGGEGIGHLELGRSISKKWRRVAEKEAREGLLLREGLLREGLRKCCRLPSVRPRLQLLEFRHRGSRSRGRSTQQAPEDCHCDAVGIGRRVGQSAAGRCSCCHCTVLHCCASTAAHRRPPPPLAAATAAGTGCCRLRQHEH